MNIIGARLTVFISVMVLAFFYIGYFFIGRVPATIVVDAMLVGLFVATTVSLGREAFVAIRRGILDGVDSFLVGVWGSAVFLSLYFLYIIVYNSMGVAGAAGPSEAQNALRATPISGTLHCFLLLSQSYILFSPIVEPKKIVKGSVLGLAVACTSGGIVAGVAMTMAFFGLIKFTA